MKGMSCRANLYKEFIVRTINEIIDGNNTVYVTKSSEALKKALILFFNSTLKKPPGTAYSIYVKQ